MNQCEHLGRGSYCITCVEAMELQKSELLMQHESMLGKLEAANRLNASLQNALREMLKTYPASTFCDVDCSTVSPCEHCALEMEVLLLIEKREVIAQKGCMVRSPGHIQAGTLTCNGKDGHKGRHETYSNGTVYGWD